MIFELAQDFHDAMAAMPQEHPKHRMLELLEEAIRRDIQFIDRHPTTLFQCMWNTCWWYDCPDLAAHYEEAESGWGHPPHWIEPGPKLHPLLESWGATRQCTSPGFRWLRALHPPTTHLGMAQRAVFAGHSRGVISVTYSPDGTLLASGSWDETVRVWDVATGRELTCLRAHEQGVTSVAYSPDGKCIAGGVGSWHQKNCTVRVWDAATGRKLTCLRGHRAMIWSVAFSPDGTLLASASYDNTLRLWDATAWREMACLCGHKAEVRSVAFSPDGTLLASASYDNTLRVWDATTGQELACLRGHEEKVNSLAFSPDGSRLASGSGALDSFNKDNTVRVWDLSAGLAGAARGRELACLRGHEKELTSVAFSPDGTRLASASDDKTVRLWDAGTHRELACLRGHEERVTSVAFSPGGSRLASASDDRTVRLWDADTNRELSCLRGHKGRVEIVAFSPDGARLASGGKAGWCSSTLWMWELVAGMTSATSGRKLIRLKHYTLEGCVKAVAFSQDGTRLATGGIFYPHAPIQVWDVGTGRKLDHLPGYEHCVNRLAFSPDGTRLASVGGWSENRKSSVWDVVSRACLEVVQGEADATAIAAGPEAHPFRAFVRHSETVIEEAVAGTPVAWFPAALFHITTHPTESTWAGGVGNYLCLVRLEGAELP